MSRDSIKDMKLATLIRTANDSGYTTVQWEQWEQFLKARNESAHVYREGIADDILQKAPGLLAAAEEIIGPVMRKEGH